MADYWNPGEEGKLQRLCVRWRQTNWAAITVITIFFFFGKCVSSAKNDKNLLRLRPGPGEKDVFVRPHQEQEKIGDAVPFRDMIWASRPLSLSERPRNWETSAQYRRDHTWCTAVIIPVCVLCVKNTADTGMSHRLQSHAERQKKWGEHCRQIPGVPPFVFSCKLRCLEEGELNGNRQLEVTLWKYGKQFKWGRKTIWLRIVCVMKAENTVTDKLLLSMKRSEKGGFGPELTVQSWKKNQQNICSSVSRQYTRLTHASSSLSTYLGTCNKTNSCCLSWNIVSHAVAVTTSESCIPLCQSGFNSQITLIQ